MFPISATTLPLSSPANTRYELNGLLGAVGSFSALETFFFVFACLEVTEPVLVGGAMALAGLEDMVGIGIVAEEMDTDMDMVEMNE